MKHQVTQIKICPGEPCGDKFPFCISNDSEVLVHVYDLWGCRYEFPRMVNSTVATRYGMFHTGVEVYGREWYFGGGSGDSFHGVYCMDEPRRHPLHRYRRTVSMGRTSLSAADVEELLPLLRMKWPAWSYNVFKRNCHTFTNFFCMVLGFSEGPRFGIFASGDAKLTKDTRLPNFTACYGCAKALGRCLVPAQGINEAGYPPMMDNTSLEGVTDQDSDRERGRGLAIEHLLRDMPTQNLVVCDRTQPSSTESKCVSV